MELRLENLVAAVAFVGARVSGLLVFAPVSRQQRDCRRA